MNPEKNPWTIKGTKVKYNNPWIRVREDQVLDPSGKDTIYGVVEFKSRAVAIIPLDEKNNTWLVGQYRYAIESYEWEIPEGGSPMDENPLETAKRELIEEVGLKAASWQLLLEMQLSNSTTNELSLTYIARDLEYVGSNPDDCEELQIKKVPFQKVYEMTLNGEIKDSLSVASILKAKILLDEGKI